MSEKLLFPAHEIVEKAQIDLAYLLVENGLDETHPIVGDALKDITRARLRLVTALKGPKAEDTP